MKTRGYSFTFPDLQISIEHASTAKAVELVRSDDSGKTVCTITPQHLLFTANELYQPDLSWRNHLKCMPYVKTPDDRDALVEFATSGDYRCFLGDDTAPPSFRQQEEVV